MQFKVGEIIAVIRNLTYVINKTLMHYATPVQVGEPYIYRLPKQHQFDTINLLLSRICGVLL